MPTLNFAIIFLGTFLVLLPTPAHSACEERRADSDPSGLFQRILDGQPIFQGGQGKIYSLEGSSTIHKVVSYGSSKKLAEQILFSSVMSEVATLEFLADRPPFLQMLACFHYTDAKVIVIETERLDHDLTKLRCRDSPDLCVGVMLQVCEGLAELHSLGLAHNDIKPENLGLLGGQVKLMDFGMASQLGEEVEGGTKGYLPNEYITANRNTGSDGYEFTRQPLATAERDVYAAGVTFAVLLLGHQAVFRDADDQHQIWKLESIFLYQEEIKSRINKAVFRLPEGQDGRGLQNLGLFIQEMIHDDPAARPKLPEAIDFLSHLYEHGVDALSPGGALFATDYWTRPQSDAVPDAAPEVDFSFI